MIKHRQFIRLMIISIGLIVVLSPIFINNLLHSQDNGCLIPESDPENTDIFPEVLFDNPLYHGKITYSHDANLFIYNFESGELNHFDDVPLMVNPAWSPDGQQIALGRTDIYVLDATTYELTSLTPGGDREWDPAWSPDGTRLVYSHISGERGLYILDIETLNEIPIPISGRYSRYNPSWSPDGQYIAFAMKDFENHAQIYIMDAACVQNDNCELEQLTNEYGNSDRPDWSPDGRQIAFSSDRHGSYAIYVMNADGSDQRRLTDNEYGDMSPAWSPDGQYIAFERDAPGPSKVYIMNADGSNITCITGTGGREPDWWMSLSDLDG